MHVHVCVSHTYMTKQVKERVKNAISQHWTLPSHLIENYAPFASLLSGEAEKKIQKALSNRQQGKDTIKSLAALSNLCRYVSLSLCMYVRIQLKIK